MLAPTYIDSMNSSLITMMLALTLLIMITQQSYQSDASTYIDSMIHQHQPYH